ncbi:TPA: hypothetical protein RG830_000421 [Vibrio vulnificus]|nr:hypothetical protein [Vibrio vulnificus]HDU8731453.1 hypothetical protein [Vibrio vulnificus]HDU8764721.1 hypothetical protein [Vibrio vulnificus]
MDSIIEKLFFISLVVSISLVILSLIKNSKKASDLSVERQALRLALSEELTLISNDLIWILESLTEPSNSYSEVHIPSGTFKVKNLFQKISLLEGAEVKSIVSTSKALDDLAGKLSSSVDSYILQNDLSVLVIYQSSFADAALIIDEVIGKVLNTIYLLESRRRMYRDYLVS